MLVYRRGGKGNNLPGDDEQDAAHSQVGQQDVDPDVRSHGVQEGEEAVFGGIGFAVQDADAGVHEGFGEVDGLFPHVGDGERSHCQVCSLGKTKHRYDGTRLLRGVNDVICYCLLLV